MNAVLSIELEILEPALLTSAQHLLQLHPSQVRWVSIRLAADDISEGEVAITAQVDDARASIHELVSFARKVQPSGTSVRVWFQGRCEGFVL